MLGGDEVALFPVLCPGVPQLSTSGPDIRPEAGVLVLELPDRQVPPVSLWGLISVS